MAVATAPVITAQPGYQPPSGCVQSVSAACGLGEYRWVSTRIRSRQGTVPIFTPLTQFVDHIDYAIASSPSLTSPSLTSMLPQPPACADPSCFALALTFSPGKPRTFRSALLLIAWRRGRER